MDTKLKNIRYSVWFKLLALFCAVAGVLLMATGVLRYNNILVAVQGDYLHSNELSNRMGNTADSIYRAYVQYADEDAIKATRATVVGADEEANLRAQAQTDISAINDDYYTRIHDQLVLQESYGDQEAFAAERQDAVKEQQRLETEREQKVQARQQQVEDDLNQRRDDEISFRLSRYRDALNNLKGQLGDFEYAWKAADGRSGGSISPDVNAMDDRIKYNPVYLITEANGLVQTNMTSYGTPTLSNGETIWLGMTEEAYSKQLGDWVDRWQNGMNGIEMLGGGFALFLLGMGWLLYAAGRRPAGEGVQLIAIDRLPLDVMLVLIGAGVSLCVAGAISLNIYFQNLYGQTVDLLVPPWTIYGAGAALLLTIATLFTALFLTMFTKRLKRGEVLRHTLIWWVLRLIGRAIRALWRLAAGGPVPLRAFAITLVVAGFNLIIGAWAVFVSPNAGGFLAFLWVMVALVGDFLLALWWLRRLQRLERGVQRIRAGELNHRLNASGTTLVAKLGDGINNIADGLHTAVEREVRAERMKAELITNVSHDLKTPLTSLITYLDLLKKEGPESENAARYMEVLQEKAQRLKALTEDLTEAARAASGSINVQRQSLDLVALLQQSLGEYEAKLSAANLSVKFSAPEGATPVMADGKLLWRVVDNLLSNVCKYAFAGSRVYLDVAREGAFVRFTMKNISARELNVPAEDLTERFVRGDESRHSEGSGLGLSIARNLTELMGGSFALSVDGDLFKVTVGMPVAPEKMA